MKKILGITLLLVSFNASFLNAQNFDGLYHQKVQSLDSTIETLYTVISGDAGEPRDWNLFKYLFVNEGKLIPIRKSENGRTEAQFMSPEDYVERSGAWLEKNGFFEKEVSRIEETYGALTHVFSTYESFRTSEDKVPFMRGINSIQLLNDGDRWWIVNITWQGESKEFPLPDKYLKSD